MKTKRNRRDKIFWIGAVVLILALVGGMVWLQSRHHAPQAQAALNNTPVNLGFSYLNITPRLSAYYGLGAGSGALVTEVAPGSQADYAGIKPGDIIYSFNNVMVKDGTPLFGMMQACPEGSQIVIEVLRGETCRLIELRQIAR